MILYHAISSYHMLNALVHSRTFEQDADLIVYDHINASFLQCKKLKEFFRSVIPYDMNYADRHDVALINNYFKSLLPNIDQYDQIFVWGAHYSFGVFLTENKVPFIFCEDGAGLLSRPQILRNVFMQQKPQDSQTAIEMGLVDGDNPMVSELLGNLNAQESGYVPAKKVVDFDVVGALYQMSEQDRAEIMKFFISICSIQVKEHTVILLTQHFANLNMLSFEEQALIYQMFVDYFLLGRNLVIKPHPDDLMYYHQLFPEAQVIREKFPSEFMPFLLDNQPDCVATISSTAIYNLRGHYPTVLELDNRYERDFPMTHRYYAAVYLVRLMGKPVACVGANEVLVQRLLDTLEGEVPALVEKGAVPCTVLVDNLTQRGEEGRQEALRLLEELDTRSAVIFINSQADYCWYDYDRKDLWDFITPVVLEKKIRRPEGQDFYADPSAEVIYFYSKNEEMRRMAQTAHIQKELPHTGIDWEQSIMTEEQERIKVLEGILAATEKRLLYYIEKEREAGGKSK